MSWSLKEAIARANHSAGHKGDDKLNTNPEPNCTDRLTLGVQGFVISFSRWLKKKKKIDVREVAILAGSLIATVCVCSLPSVLYFALVVSLHVSAQGACRRMQVLC